MCAQSCCSTTSAHTNPMCSPWLSWSVCCLASLSLVSVCFDCACRESVGLSGAAASSSLCQITWCWCRACDSCCDSRQRGQRFSQPRAIRRFPVTCAAICCHALCLHGGCALLCRHNWELSGGHSLVHFAEMQADEERPLPCVHPQEEKRLSLPQQLSDHAHNKPHSWCPQYQTAR